MKAIITKPETKEIVYERVLRDLRDMKFEGAGISATNVKLLDEARQTLHDQLDQNLTFLKKQVLRK